MQKVEQPRVGFYRLADSAQFVADGARLGEQRIHAAQTDGTRPRGDEGGHQFLVHGTRQHLQHGIEHFRSGYTKAVDEAAFDAALCKEARHLLASAMHHYSVETSLDSGGDFRGEACARIR